MTLNICLTTRHAVYLSGDFRLTYTQGQKRWFKDDFDSQKLIPIVKYGWCGLVAFCGVAKLPNGRQVGDWIAEQVRAEDMEGTLGEAIGRLRGADSWLAPMRTDKRFSMVIAGFEQRRPFIEVLSNFQSLDGREWYPASKQLELYDHRPKSFELRYFGDRNAAGAIDRNAIEELVRKEPHRNVMPEIGGLNRTVSGDTISKECVVGYVLPTGEIQIAPAGRWPGYMPRFVLDLLYRMGIRELIPKLGPDGQPLQPFWVGTSYKNGTLNGIDSLVALPILANVEQPIGVEPPPGTAVGWKIAGESEPPVTVKFGPREDGKRESVRRRKRFTAPWQTRK
jgi:hypothetical protein